MVAQVNDALSPKSITTNWFMNLMLNILKLENSNSERIYEISSKVER